LNKLLTFINIRICKKYQVPVHVYETIALFQFKKIGVKKIFSIHIFFCNCGTNIFCFFWLAKKKVKKSGVTIYSILKTVISSDFAFCYPKRTENISSAVCEKVFNH